MADSHFTPCPPAIPSVTVAPRFSEQTDVPAPRFDGLLTNTCFNAWGLYDNEAQSYTSTCSGLGAPITVTIVAGAVVSSLSVADANYKALAKATHDALALRVLTPCH